MKTITKEFEGIYGNGGPLGMGKNLTTKNMLNRIPNKQYQNNVATYNTNVATNVSENIEGESGIPYILITVFIVLILIGIIYYFRNDIYNYFVDVSKGMPDKPPEDETTKKLKEEENIKKMQADLNSIKAQEEEIKKNQQQINNGGVQQLDNKLNAISGYKQEQLVKENSYCYIGTDNGQRECINAYSGDVCLSGQIFPKMEVCINPRLRI